MEFDKEKGIIFKKQDKENKKVDSLEVDNLGTIQLNYNFKATKSSVTRIDKEISKKMAIWCKDKGFSFYVFLNSLLESILNDKIKLDIETKDITEYKETKKIESIVKRVLKDIFILKDKEKNGYFEDKKRLKKAFNTLFTNYNIINNYKDLKLYEIEKIEGIKNIIKKCNYNFKLIEKVIRSKVKGNISDYLRKYREVFNKM